MKKCINRGISNPEKYQDEGNTNVNDNFVLTLTLNRTKVQKKQLLH